jgi:hypothetical protein
MPALLPFSSALSHDVFGEDPPSILRPPAIPTLLKTHLGQLRLFYELAPTDRESEISPSIPEKTVSAAAHPTR